ncbi:MAG: AbrB/MazE/SpoVT family DNA-binding domain-containing protein [Terriglobales bacterium]
MRSRRTKISTKGQVTTPTELRERLGIGKGTRVNWKEGRGRLVLTSMTGRQREELKYALLAGLQGESIEIPLAEIRKMGLVAALRRRTRRK